MRLQHFNYFWWDSEGPQTYFPRDLPGNFFFYTEVKEGRVVKRNASYISGQVVEEGDTR